VRKKVMQKLAQRLYAALKSNFPECIDLAKEDPRFPGIIGFRLIEVHGRSVFLTVIPHDQEDSFMCSLAWAGGGSYPDSPYRDLRENFEQHWERKEAEVQLADVVPEKIPYEFEIDQRAERAKEARNQISERLARGDQVSECEWLDTLVEKCSLEDAFKRVDGLSELISEAARDAVGELRKLQN
jgi:hypothetical protein